MPIHLTPREFALLEALVTESGTVRTKQELIDSVWGMNYDGPPNIVEVCVGYLRNNADRPFGCAAIETVRVIGDRVVP